MIAYPGFGVLLARLMVHRQLSPAVVAREAEVSEVDLRTILDDGEPPSSELLRRLASLFGFHIADMHALAGLAVPRELAPLDPGAGPWVPRLIKDVAALRPDHRRRLRQTIKRIPQGMRTGAVLNPPAYEQYPLSAGAVVVRMFHNRNLNWSGAAKVLLVLSGIGLSPATIGAVGRGKKELSSELLSGFALILGISPKDLAVMFEIEGVPHANDPDLADVAQFAWDVRHLTADQIQAICHEATGMRQSY